MDDFRMPADVDAIVLNLVAWTVIAVVAFVLMVPTVRGAQPPMPGAPLPPVYHPQRLEVIQPMVTREGIVENTPVHQGDGDLTFKLLSIPINEVLHVEITCVFPPEFPAAREACAGYTNHVRIPHAGEYIRVTGPLVRDLVHDAQYHELEIHPAVAIDILSN
jgi:hypothetical protein